LRAVTDLKAIKDIQIQVDCDVLQADGGTRTAAITGAYVALYEAFRHLRRIAVVETIPLRDAVAAVSCGIYEATAILDLDYAEDSAAQADANFVLTGNGQIIEVQMTAESAPFSEAQLMDMLALAKNGVRELAALQRAALGIAESGTSRQAGS
jgi:ribonuclease PH